MTPPAGLEDNARSDGNADGIARRTARPVRRAVSRRVKVALMGIRKEHFREYSTVLQDRRLVYRLVNKMAYLKVVVDWTRVFIPLGLSIDYNISN